jgi:hypothetical protein
MLLSEVFDYSADTMAIRGYWRSPDENPTQEPVCMLTAIHAVCRSDRELDIEALYHAQNAMGVKMIEHFSDRADQDTCIAKFRELAQQCRNEGL